MDVTFQLLSIPLFLLSFIKLLILSFCLNHMIYCFPQHVSCFILLLACSQFISMFFHACLYVFCLDIHVCMHVLCSYAYVYAFTCLQAWIRVLPYFYAYIHMLRCTFTCLNAYFHAYMCRLVCLHAQIDVLCMLYAIFHMLVHSMPCLCAQTQAIFVMPCAIVALLSLLSLFLVFCSISLDQIQTLWSLSSSMYHGLYQQGLDHPYLHVYACLLTCLFAFLTCLLAFLFLCLPCLSCLFHMLFASFSFHCFSIGFLSLSLHVYTWNEDAWRQGMVSQA